MNLELIALKSALAAAPQKGVWLVKKVLQSPDLIDLYRQKDPKIPSKKYDNIPEVYKRLIFAVKASSDGELAEFLEQIK